MTGGSTLSPFLPQGKSPNTSRRGNSTSMLKLRNAQGSGVPTMQTGFLLQSLSTVLLASCLLVLLLAPEFSTANTLTPRQQAVQRLLHQNTPVTPNLWQQFKDFFQTTPINQTRFANATFMIFYNITSGHPGGRQNRTFWLNTTRTIVHVQTESPVVSKSASEGSQYTPTNLPSTTTGSDSTAEDPDPQYTGPYCQVAESSRRTLRSVTGDQLVHAVTFGCNLTSNARQDGASMPKPVSSVACSLDRVCHAVEKRQELIQHMQGIEEIFSASKCGCSSSSSAAGTPSCIRRRLVHHFYPGTSIQSSVDVGECYGTCPLTGKSCKPISEKTVNILSPSGSTCVTKVETCGCAGTCYFKPHREVYLELKVNSRTLTNYTVEREIMTGTCEGFCQPPHKHSPHWWRCAPDRPSASEVLFVGHHGKLVRVPVIRKCVCKKSYRRFSFL